MKSKTDLFEVYDRLSTDELLRMHAKGLLTEEAYEVLESVLASRTVPIPKRPIGGLKGKVKAGSTSWAMGFAFFGAALPVLCLAFDFKPDQLRSLCEVCWPSAFLLFAAEGHFNLAVYAVSIVVNALVWAGFGWLIGYGLSGRHKHDA